MRAPSSLSPPDGGVKSIQLKFPVLPPPEENRPLIHSPIVRPKVGAGPLEHTPSGTPQLVCAGAVVAVANAETVFGAELAPTRLRNACMIHMLIPVAPCAHITYLAVA